jgi:hypothetical protein
MPRCIESSKEAATIQNVCRALPADNAHGSHMEVLWHTRANAYM